MVCSLYRGFQGRNILPSRYCLPGQSLRECLGLRRSDFEVLAAGEDAEHFVLVSTQGVFSLHAPRHRRSGEAAFRVAASDCVLSENHLMSGRHQGVTMLNQNGKVSRRGTKRGRES